MKTLICDLNVYDNGHHIAYVNTIMEYSADREDLIFLFNADAASWCKGLKEDKRVFFLREEYSSLSDCVYVYLLNESV